MSVSAWSNQTCRATSTQVDDTEALSALSLTTNYLGGSRSYLMPTTIESGPTSGSTREEEKPASFIHPQQSAPV